jgi:hypothetical protein
LYHRIYLTTGGRLTNCPRHSQTILETSNTDSIKSNKGINQMTFSIRRAFPTVFTLFAKLNKPQISEEEKSAIDAARQSLNIYYANLHKDRDHALARRQWLKLNNHQIEIHALLDESVNPEALYALGVELQRAKGTIRSDYDF